MLQRFFGALALCVLLGATAHAQPAAAPAPDPCPDAAAAGEDYSAVQAALDACLAREGLSTADQAQLWRRMGDAYAMLERGTPTVQAYDRAEALMTEAEITPPPLMIATRGRALQLIGQDERALADLSRALQVRPRWARTRFYRAQVLTNLRRRDEAIEDLRRAARTPAMAAPANATLATLLLAQGDDAGALAAADAAIARSAENRIAHQVRCEVLSRDGGETGEAACARALALDPENAVTQRNAARYVAQPAAQ